MSLFAEGAVAPSAEPAYHLPLVGRCSRPHYNPDGTEREIFAFHVRGTEMLCDECAYHHDRVRRWA